MNGKDNEKSFQSHSPLKELVENMRYSDIRLGGVEGGATKSVLIVMDGKGKQLAKVHGPGTNHWALGMKGTALRLNNMITEAKRQLNMPETIPFHCVGLSLSGCEEEETNNILVETLCREYPNAAEEYFIGSDTQGSLKTGLSNGGIVLITGTGSNALLINPDGKTYGCGGWGDRIGDEASAYWIAHRACKYVFDDVDDFQKPPHPTTYVLPAMLKFFQVSDRNAMLAHLYGNFDKSKFAMFTRTLAAGCEEGDALCLSLFEDAGRMLAKYTETVSKKAHDDLKSAPGGLKVVCVGSVWKSWSFLKKGFTSQIKQGVVEELTLLRLKTSAAVGACFLAAEKLGLDSVTKNYESNTEVFYHYVSADPENDKLSTDLVNSTAIKSSRV